MRFRVAMFLIYLTALTGAAQAGPWLREQGSSFVSVSFTTTYYLDTGNASYLEFGVRDDLTLGADVGYFTSRFGQTSGFGTIFMRRPLGPNDGPNRWAYELGVGAAWVDDLVFPHIKTGVSWGRGFTLKERNGWMTVDSSVTWNLAEGPHLTKVDGTLGYNFTDVTSGMLQVYLSHLDDEFYGTIAPSVVIKPRKANFRIQIGGEIPVDDAKNAALKVGIWREF